MLHVIPAVTYESGRLAGRAHICFSHVDLYSVKYVACIVRVRNK